MTNLVRVTLLLIVGVIGFAGLYGSSFNLDCSESELACDDWSALGGLPGVVANPEPLIPSPVVSINDRGEGLAAYAVDGEIIVRRFNGTAGFAEPVTVAVGVEEDLDVVAAGGTARIAWRGANGQVSVLNGDAHTTTWHPQIELAANVADDPLFANGMHSSLARGSLSWRVQGVGSTGLPLVQGYGSSSLLAPHTLLTRYAPGADVSPGGLFDLRTATAGVRTIAVWTAAQRSDSLFSHVYVAVFGDGQPGEAQRLTAVTSGVGHTAVDMDEAGNALVLWAQANGLYFSRYLVSSNSWSAPMAVVSEVNALLRDVQIDVAPNGHAIAAWTAGNTVWSAVSNVSNIAWGHIQQLDRDGSTPLNGRDPRVAIDPTGRALVVWRNEGSVYVNEHVASNWTPPALLGTTQSAPELDVNDTGLGVAVWWNDGLQHRIWNARESVQASFTVSPYPGVAGLGVTFDAQASGGPFPITSYSWDWENDGQFDGSGGPAQSRIYESPGMYTARLRVMDTAGQMAETTRSVSIVAIGEVSSQVIVNYAGPGDGLIEIDSTEPGFVPVRCSTSTPAGQPTDTGTCIATVRGGYDVTVAAEYDPVRSTFSGWPCRDVVTSTTPTGTRTECRFIANNRDLTFEATFRIAAPTTEILRIELHPFSQGGGDIFDSTGRVYCIVQNQRIRTRVPPDGNCSYSFDWGTSVHLYAAAQVGSSLFAGWQGCDSQPSPTECVVAMTRLRVVTAQFSGG